MSSTKGSVLVAGASRGIGEQIARRLSASGYKVVLAARSAKQLAAIAGSLPSAAAAPVDFSDLAALEGWFEKCAAEHGPFSGLVFCAGVLPSSPLKDVDLPMLEATFRVNAMAPILLTKAFRRPDAFRAPASIVFISSVMGIVGQPVRTLYSASKAAQLGFVRSAALELARQGIRVNAVAPGVVETEFTKQFMSMLSEDQRSAVVHAHALGLGAPDDVAQAVEFLIGEQSKWITGTTLVVDGGYTAK
ncbi:MAG: SDR family oxidoreductase [bacterium]